LNALLDKRQREAKRLRRQVAGITAKPQSGTSLKRLAVQASLASSLSQQNETLAAENEALRRDVACSGAAGELKADGTTLVSARDGEVEVRDQRIRVLEALIEQQGWQLPDEAWGTETAGPVEESEVGSRRTSLFSS
jgi:hypothetical protein